MHTSPETADQSKSNKGLAILVVDDEPLFGEVMSTLLTPEGHNVLYLDNYRDAVQHMQHMRFDLAFIGAVMPGADGRDVAALVRTLSPRTRVFLFIEPAAEAWAASLRREGHNVGSLVAPFEPSELLAIVDSVKATRVRRRQRCSSSS